MAYGSPRRRRRRKHQPGLLRALGLTAASVLVPGTAHLAARRRLAGGVLLASFLALIATAAVVYFAVPRSRLLRLAVEPRMLRYAMVAGVVLGLTWMLLVLSSYAVTRPRQLNGWKRAVGAVVVSVLALTVAAPFALGVRTAYVQHDLISHVFGDNLAPDWLGGWGGGGGGPVAAGGDQRFINKPRVNVLLLGSDAAPGRDGVRTDSMILASVDTKTGNTVLISLPRNLQRVRFPPGTPMAHRFPRGFPDLLNALYRYGEDHREVAPGARYPGAQLLKQAFGYSVGLDVDYFVMVNLAGFQQIVDALGGVRINVEKRIPIGGHASESGRVVVPPSRYLEPGPQVLNGYEALWYGRSRMFSDDYTRMRRQRCLLGAIARQADPIRVLTRYQQLASATKRIVVTDIPQQALPELVELALKGKEANITSVTFVRSARFHPSSPDFSYVRSQVRAALRKANQPPAAVNSTPQLHAGTARPSASGASGSAAPSGSVRRGAARAAPSPTPEAGPVAVDEVCSYA